MYKFQTFKEWLNEGYYEETSWTREIDGKEVTITIQEVQDYLKDAPIIEIPVEEIEDMCVHKDKKDKKTLDRAKAANLKYPILIAKDDKGNYVMVLDGHHRLKKSIEKDNKTIKAKVLDLKDAPINYKKMFT